MPDTAYELTFVENGEGAVVAFDRGRFDVVLMDVQMPVMDGLTATSRIRELEHGRAQAPTKIMALTANASEEDVRRSLTAGCDGHLAKPISREKLVAALESLRGNTLAASEPNVVNIPSGFEDRSRSYIQQQLDSVTRARLYLAGRSFEDLRSMGHKMKGTGASFGFPNLSTLGASIEEAAKTSDLESLALHLTNAEEYVRYASQHLC